MRFKPVGNKRDEVIVVVKSAETVTKILAGSPVFLACNGTDDGLAVLACESVTSAKSGLLYGIALSDIAISQGTNPVLQSPFGEVKVYGFMENVRIVLRTRATTTDAWGARTAIVVGDSMIPTINIAGVQGVQRQTAGTTGIASPDISAGAAVASAVSLASGGTTSDALTTANGIAEYITTGKVFIRVM